MFNFRSLACVCALLVTASFIEADLTHPLGRRIELRNEAGGKMAIEWVHPITGKRVPYYESSTPGEKISFESYVNHTWLLRDLSDNVTESFITVLEDKQDQVIVVKEHLELERLLEDAPKNEQSEEMVKKCRKQADVRLANGQKPEQVMDGLIKCLERETAVMIQAKNEELNFERDVRKCVANLAENYTCADPEMVTTTPKEIKDWEYEGVNRTVGILHNRKDSQIHILHDFISQEECDAIVEAAKPLLHRGTVADGKGGSKMSENRKAWQAGIKVKDWRDTTDPIANVKRRLFAYANYAAGYNMTLPGQEDIMSIQYFGNGKDDRTPDRYTPHCDGDCDGMPHKTGGRVATMVMYCDVPDVGGSTNFQNANVYVKPKKGAAAFFSYMDPITYLHEEGFTSHSGCPVYEGTKRIAVQWMRIGVDEANPWDSFDTNTMKKKD